MDRIYVLMSCIITAFRRQEAEWGFSNNKHK